jgi:ABC-2 type transport system permease protein
MHKLWAFVLRDARLALSYPFTIWTQFGSVIITVAGFYYMNVLVKPSVHLGVAGKPLDYFTYVVANLAFMLLLTSAFQAFSQTLRRDQLAGTLEAIFVTPTGIWMIAMASGAWPILYALMQTLLYFAFAFAFGLHFSAVNFGTLALFLGLGTACMAALGILGAAIVIRYQQAPPATFLVGSAASLLSGVLFPVGLFPPIIRVISWLLPMTHALNGLRAALLGFAPAAVMGDLLWLTLAATLLVPVSLLVFTYAFNVTVRDGTLAYY